MAVASVFSQLKTGMQTLTSGHSVSRGGGCRRFLRWLVIALRKGEINYKRWMKRNSRCWNGIAFFEIQESTSDNRISRISSSAVVAV